jgi:hypothetical protein
MANAAFEGDGDNLLYYQTRILYQNYNDIGMQFKIKDFHDIYFSIAIHFA